MLEVIFVSSSLVRSILGTSSQRVVKRMMPTLQAIRDKERTYVAMTSDELRAQTALFKERLAQVREEFRQQHTSDEVAGEGLEKALRQRMNEELDALLPDAFGVVREASKRIVGMRPFDVQIVGGIVLHEGNIAEMVTGEGKTLVAAMPVYLNALTGDGVHIVTVNDYLARRDHEWMGPIFKFLGLTVGVIQHDINTSQRQVSYRADITYGTNNEFGFDYLRDNMAVRREWRVQRVLNYAIVDEVDSILIDEARTPLIISGRPEKGTDLYEKVDRAVRQLRKEKDFELEEKGHHVMLTEDGMAKAEKLMGVEDLFVEDSIGIVHMIEQSIRAHHFYKKDDEYLVRDGEVLIVDEFTGRAMEGRRWSDGLHEAIEAKEGVRVQLESQTVATITYQNYFRLYTKLAGMTGTAATEGAEFAQIYNLDVVRIPTNLPLIREDKTDLVFATKGAKEDFVVDEIVSLHETGRPILVGTVSVEKSEELATKLSGKGIEDFQVLNAKFHELEAAIVASAGRRGAITIATNMAGRGTDIKLAEGVRELGGLAIIGTERHESRRIDNQLRGRCGRQGDPGSTAFYVSLEDEVAKLFGGDRVKRLIERFGGDQLATRPIVEDRKKLDATEEGGLLHFLRNLIDPAMQVYQTISRAQRSVEEYNFEMRKHLLEYDTVMNKQRTVIYEMRRDVLEDRDVTERLHGMFEDLIEDAVDMYAPESVEPEEWDTKALSDRFKKLFGFGPDLAAGDTEPPKPLAERLLDQALAEYARREQLIADEIHQDCRKKDATIDEAQIDFAKSARKYVHNLELMALLQAVDSKWIDHLYSMDYLRESVRLRAYGQKDPLVEYKTEGFEIFQGTMSAIEEKVTETLFRVMDPKVRLKRRAVTWDSKRATKNDPFEDLSHYTYVGADKYQDHSFASYDTSRFALAGQRVKRQPIRVVQKINPNAPCPCGSGKKYKKCCGALHEN
jgi:preprotein translocase subunit SecA